MLFCWSPEREGGSYAVSSGFTVASLILQTLLPASAPLHSVGRKRYGPGRREAAEAHGCGAPGVAARRGASSEGGCALGRHGRVPGAQHRGQADGASTFAASLHPPLSPSFLAHITPPHPSFPFLPPSLPHTPLPPPPPLVALCLNRPLPVLILQKT